MLGLAWARSDLNREIEVGLVVSLLLVLCELVTDDCELISSLVIVNQVLLRPLGRAGRLGRWW